MSEPQLNDPWFYDETDFIECKVCNEEFDHNTYNSLTCSQCEDDQTEVIK
jgi:Zn finger protein HypA/HybF involved in hydrogenase expression